MIDRIHLDETLFLATAEITQVEGTDLAQWELRSVCKKTLTSSAVVPLH